MRNILVKVPLLAIYLLFGTKVDCHQQSVHQYITRQAFNLLKMSFPNGLTEMENYIGSSQTLGSTSVVSWGALKIVSGAWIEDEYDVVYHYGLGERPTYNQDVPQWLIDWFEGDERRNYTSITHFWDADDGQNDQTLLHDTMGDLQIYWSFYCENALQKIRKYYNGDYNYRWLWDSKTVNQSCSRIEFGMDFDFIPLFNLYNGQDIECVQYLGEDGNWHTTSCPSIGLGKACSYEILGRMCHLLQDMSVPAHVHCNSHACEERMYCEYYENHEINYDTTSAAIIWNNGGRFINPFNEIGDPLYFLMYFMNQIADHFADGLTDGDNNYSDDDFTPYLNTILPNLGSPTTASQINDTNCRAMNNILIPYAIEVTAGLMYWFAKMTDQIPITTSGYLYYNEDWDETITLIGNVFVPSGITLTIKSGVTVNLGSYSIISSGGTITIESGAVINSSNSHVRLVTGSTINRLCPTIASAAAAVSSGQTIEIYGPHTLTANYSIPSVVSLSIKSGATLTLGSYSIISSGGTISVENGASISPNIKIVNGSTIKGLYSSIADAIEDVSSGETISLSSATYSVSTNLILGSGVTLSLPSSSKILFTNGATLTLGSGASVSPDIRLKQGTTLKGLYGSIELAATDAISGQSIVPSATTYSNLGDITIGSGVYLTLSSGTQLKFQMGSDLICNGILQATGTTFIRTSTNSGYYWNGIRLNSGSSNSYLTNCTIEYALINLYIDNCSPSISNTDIKNSSCYGVFLTGNSYGTFTNTCEITNNGVFGVVVDENAFFEPCYCLISDNGFEGESAEESGGGIINVGESYIRYSQISGNNMTGVYVYDGLADLGYDAVDGYGYNGIANTTYEIYSLIANEVPAYYNYWGNDNGPNTNKLYGDIGYDPWCPESEYQYSPWGLGKARPGNTDLTLYREGMKKMRSKKYDDASEVFAEFLSVFPNSYYWRFALNHYVQILQLQNKNTEINDIFTSIQNRNVSEQNRSHLIVIQANYFRKTGRSDEAVYLLNNACTATNDTSYLKRFKFQLAHALFDIGDSVSIVSSYQNFINEYPNDYRSKIIASEYKRYTGQTPTIQPIPEETPIFQAPSSFKFAGSSPNPFNMSTTIAFDLPEESKVELIIYDLMGREIWKSAKTNYAAGTYSIVWNGVNHSGQSVGTGMYLVRLNSAKYNATQKVLLMK